jgi:hypothetical protein
MNRNDQELGLAPTSRRDFLVRNVVGMGAVAGSAFLARTRPAQAQGLPGCGPSGDTPPKCCFLKGAKIRTAEGERAVEDLAIGDLLPTEFGGRRPIQWVGRYHYKKSDPSKPWVEDAQPVRIARSALADNVPQADLFVTQSHALLIDGVLVTAGSLINGTTITLYAADEFDALEFFHIKLETHDIVYAEGAGCETLLTVDEKANNFAEYLRKYGEAKTNNEPCLPILSFNGGRSEAKSRMRSAISPWFDRRQKIDVIRDRLEERGIALSRTREPVQTPCLSVTVARYLRERAAAMRSLAGMITG